MFSKLIILLLLAHVSIFSQDSFPVEKGVSQNLAIWRAESYSDVRYKLNLIIKKKAPTLKGTIEISLVNKADRIILDWRKIKDHEHLSKISNVSINGKKLILNPKRAGAPRKQSPMYSHYFEHLIFENGVKKGKNIIKLSFESPILKSGSAITRYIDKEDGSEYIYSLFVPSDASTVFPVFDQPDLKARFNLSINVPPNWKIVSNANKILSVETRVNHCGEPRGCLTSHGFIFDETKPISTYVFAFATGNFKRFIGGLGDRKTESWRCLQTLYPNKLSGNKCHNIYVRKSQAKKFEKHAKEIFRLNRESIKFFEKYFDYKFPFPKYDLVLIPEFPFGGMEHAGATFLRESSIIFPTEPTANNYISRASLLFHENAHQWFGDTVTMKWFDDLWLKEGFATFMAYKAMERVLPQYNAWKVFYERTKPRAYSTDVTKGTTPIYQNIPNLNSAKSAYGNIVYNKAPGFLKQAEFYLGKKEFQTAVRSFLKEHEFKNAEWSDLVSAFEKASKRDLKTWADTWVKKRGLPVIRVGKGNLHSYAKMGQPHDSAVIYSLNQKDALGGKNWWLMKTRVFMKHQNGTHEIRDVNLRKGSRPTKMGFARYWTYIHKNPRFSAKLPVFIFPNYGDHAYGIFLLDERSKKYALENIQNEKDDFLRSMMWGALWDSVRFSELNPSDYINLAVKNISVETDVSTINSILGRVNTAFTYYLDKSQQKQIAPTLENLLIKKIRTAKTKDERITYYRVFLSAAKSANARRILKQVLNSEFQISLFKLKTKDKFDIVTRLIILGDKDAPNLLVNLEKTEKGDAAKRFAYAAKAGLATKETKAKYWNDFVNSKETPESWIEAALRIWNSPNHTELTLPYLEKALAELPNHKQNRKIFFVNSWLRSFIGGQTGFEAFTKIEKFLTENPNLDADLKRKILERLDGLDRAVKIRNKYSK